MDNLRQPVEERLHIQEELVFLQEVFRLTPEKNILAHLQDEWAYGIDSERGADQVDELSQPVAVFRLTEG